MNLSGFQIKNGTNVQDMFNGWNNTINIVTNDNKILNAIKSI
jgi:hypothetical protein